VPTYGYRCDNQHQIEVWQRISDPPLTVCPRCRAPLRRVFYPVGIVFKGQGFYKTDSRGAPADDSSAIPATPSADGAKATGKASGEAGSSGGSPAAGSKAPEKPAETA